MQSLREAWRIRRSAREDARPAQGSRPRLHLGVRVKVETMVPPSVESRVAGPAQEHQREARRMHDFRLAGAIAAIGKGIDARREIQALEKILPAFTSVVL